MQLLARDGVGLPVATFAHDPKQTEEVLRVAGGAPVVVKLLEGTQGIGVVLADTDRSAKSVIEAFRGANINILVQEFIKEAGGTDIRAFVVGGRVIAAMKRTGAEGEFRSNLHRGGHGRGGQADTGGALDRDPLGQIHGIECLRRGHAALESRAGCDGGQPSPGLEGIEKATSIDVAGTIIDFIEKNAKQGNTRTKGKG